MRLFVICFIFAIISCSHHELSYDYFKSLESDVVSFWTPVGVFQQGTSCSVFKEALGDPQYKDVQGEYELWRYENISDENVFIVFENGLLYWVKLENKQLIQINNNKK
jgi:hypothetical protein